jgi:hypothetical protein
MPSQTNITNIPSARVDFIDPRTGLMSREWYRFFLNLFNLTGAGNNATSLDDLQIGPPSGGGEGGGGSVTSVDVSGGTTGLTTSGGPITSAGTITLAGTLAVANGGTGATTAGGARTNLGATTIGGNMFTLANPGAVTFPQFNADNTISALNAASFRTAIGAGTGTGSVTSVDATGGTGISVAGGPITTSGTLTITNTAPDQTVVMTSGTGISVTGTYPNFTVTNTSPSSGGTVTSVGTAGTVNGLTLTGGPITSSGTVTLGGTLDLSSPPAIGGTTPAAGTFTTLTATGQTSLGGAAGSEVLIVSQNAGAGRGFATASSPSAGSFRLAASRTAGNSDFELGAGGSTGNIKFVTSGSYTEQARVSHTASAVNYVQVTGAATGSGNYTTISSQGSDAAVNLRLSAKGTSTLDAQVNGATRWKINSDGSVDSGISASGGISFKANVTGSQVNYLQSAGGVAGSSPVLSSQGSDTNISQVFQSKGTGAFQFQTNAGAQEQFRVAHTASAVNYVQVTGNATTGTPIISGQGSDTNVNIGFVSKGSGEIRFASNSSGSNINFRVLHTTSSAVNYGTVTGAAAGSAPVFGVAGSDTNIDLTLTPKGTGQTKSKVFNATNGFIVNSMTVSANYTVATGDSAMSVGPMTIASGVVVTVSSGSRWVVI